MGSVGHDETLRLTDLWEVLEDEAEGGELDAKEGSDSDSEEISDEKEEGNEEEDELQSSKPKPKPSADASDDEEDVDSDSSERPVKKRKLKQKIEDPLATDKKKRRKPRKDEVVADPTFFADL